MPSLILGIKIWLFHIARGPTHGEKLYIKLFITFFKSNANNNSKTYLYPIENNLILYDLLLNG